MAFPINFLVCVLAVSFVNIISANHYENGAYSIPGDAYNYREEEHLNAIKVQGLVYCRINGQLLPLAGAMARMTCMVDDDDARYAGQLSVVSRHTDRNGYFLINMSKYQSNSIVLRECRVHLETHPPGICNVPTDVNNGVSGASLGHYRTLDDSSRLYSVPYFIYDASPY
ncbi:hypothetical protein vseg_000793 [Gypsophila vaccaria]